MNIFPFLCLIRCVGAPLEQRLSMGQEVLQVLRLTCPGHPISNLVFAIYKLFILGDII